MTTGSDRQKFQPILLLGFVQRNISILKQWADRAVEVDLPQDTNIKANTSDVEADQGLGKNEKSVQDTDPDPEKEEEG